MIFEIYLDNDFIVKFSSIYNSKNKILLNFINFLESLGPTVIYTNLENSEIDRIVNSENDCTQPLWEILVSNYPKIKGGIDPKFFIEDEMINDGNAFKLFFLDVSINNCSELRSKFGFAFFCVQDIESQWKAFYFGHDRDDLVLPITDSIKCNPKFDSWKILEKFNFPINSILIVDPYILSEKAKIKNNLVGILKVLSQKLPENSIVEIVVVAIDDEKSNEAWEAKWEILQDELRLITETKNKLSFALYRYPKNLNDHCRFILTNYWYIKSGDSFNYFTEKGLLRIVNDDISFMPTFLKRTNNVLIERLNDVKTYIDKSVSESGGTKRTFQLHPHQKKYSFLANLK